ncbi:TnsD family Tn7-like transposition protein [Cytobacillus solani]|uniref:Uncharacterized protein n=1 Tax=Cytobacillus solani TaxID=1637975 RepID=A0A0Q3VR76_9BACI|nr:TnsD family Tn7-like transposition protein [Cytobacillus solani]KQL27515.1 hypothetical protein AN957_00825 [Cytobacillus solani]
MFFYFPMIQKDELLFSVFARYHARSLNKKEKKTLKELGQSSIDPIITNKIQSFLEKLKYFLVPDIEYFLINHTIFEYYKCFLSSRDEENLYNYMVYGECDRLSLFRNLSVSTNLKYCSGCIKKDLEEIGEIYWRVHHQYPTVAICPTHHIPLELVTLRTWETDFETVNNIHKTESKKRSLSKKTFFHATKFLQQSFYLIDNQLQLYDKTKSHVYYLLFLERGFVLPSGNVDVVKLEKRIIHYFGIEFLRLINFNLDIFEEIKQTPLSFHYDTSPVEKFVFINFLFDSLTEFIEYGYKLPNGEATPFKCLNPFCKYYNQPKINYIQVFFDEDLYKVSIRFRCDECFEEYEKIFRTKDWSMIETRMDYSEKWNEGLMKKVYEEGLDIEKIAFLTNLNTLEIEGKLLKKNKYKSVDEGIAWKMKEEWTRLINANIYQSISEIKQLNFPLYAYMERNDQIWSNIPGELKSKMIINRGNTNDVLWRKRDKKVLLYFKDIVHKGIIRGKVKVYYWISYAIDELDLRSELCYLPMTRKYIEKHKLFLDKLNKNRWNFQVL